MSGGDEAGWSLLPLRRSWRRSLPARRGGPTARAPPRVTPPQAATQTVPAKDYRPILDGIRQYVDPLIPPGSQRVGFGSDQNDPYHLGADVAGAGACEWLGEFVAAQEAGDQQRMDKAAAVLATSRAWPVLQEMTARGDYSQVVWERADRAASGEVPPDYAGWLGCEG